MSGKYVIIKGTFLSDIAAGDVFLGLCNKTGIRVGPHKPRAIVPGNMERSRAVAESPCQRRCVEPNGGDAAVGQGRRFARGRQVRVLPCQRIRAGQHVQRAMRAAASAAGGCGPAFEIHSCCHKGGRRRE